MTPNELKWEQENDTYYKCPVAVTFPVRLNYNVPL